MTRGWVSKNAKMQKQKLSRSTLSFTFLVSFLRFLLFFSFCSPFLPFLSPFLPFLSPFLRFCSLITLSFSLTFFFSCFLYFCSLAFFTYARLLPVLLLSCFLYFCSLAFFTSDHLLTFGGFVKQLLVDRESLYLHFSIF